MERLKAQNPDLKDRVTDRDATIEELTEFKELALSRLAAQHDESMRLRSPQSFLEPAPPADRPPSLVPGPPSTAPAADGLSLVSSDSPSVGHFMGSQPSVSDDIALVFRSGWLCQIQAVGPATAWPVSQAVAGPVKAQDGGDLAWSPRRPGGCGWASACLSCSMVASGSRG
ncbi:hypothetical protein ACFY13_36580 [Streptomyces mirabilis]|uniref:hypothetical protein n=1 Tax=Streptomyces mirabilis TaxID=68239 RepID=UPI0036AAF236